MLYLAMAYVDGVDLRELLRREGRFDSERAVAIVRQAGEALDAAHAAGLVHRDVKPGNILVADGPTASRVRLRLRPGAARLVGRQPHRRPRLRRHGRLRGARADPRREGRRPRRRLRARLRALRVRRRRAAVRARERAGGRVRTPKRAAAAADRAAARAAGRLGPGRRARTREGAGCALRHVRRARRRRGRRAARRAGPAAAVSPAARGEPRPPWPRAGRSVPRSRFATSAAGKPVAQRAARAQGLRRAIGSSAREHPLGHAVRLRARTARRRRRGPVGVGAAAERAAAAARGCPHARADLRRRGCHGFHSAAWRRRAASCGRRRTTAPSSSRISSRERASERFRRTTRRRRGSRPAAAPLGRDRRPASRGSFPGTGPPAAASRTTGAAGSRSATARCGRSKGRHAPEARSETGRVLAATDLRHRHRRRGRRTGSTGRGRTRTGVVSGSTRTPRIRHKLALARIRADLVRGRRSGSRTARRGRSPRSTRARANRGSSGRLRGGRLRDGVVWAGTVPVPPRCRRPGGPELRLSLPGATSPWTRPSRTRPRTSTRGATCAGLLAYPDTAGVAGKRLQPEVAAAMPRVSGRRAHVHLPHPQRASASRRRRTSW